MTPVAVFFLMVLAVPVLTLLADRFGKRWPK